MVTRAPDNLTRPLSEIRLGPHPIPAVISSSHARRWWRCPRCERTLAEIVDGRVVVKVKDRRITLPLVAGIDQTCPHCGTVSEVEGIGRRR